LHRTPHYKIVLARLAMLMPQPKDNRWKAWSFIYLLCSCSDVHSERKNEHEFELEMRQM